MSRDDFKQRINKLRDILVGVVPNPTDQINQITYALIYKFLNDLDGESIELGGEPTYFQGDYARYTWAALMDPRLELRERSDLYRSALEKMGQNPNLSPLFRDIFRSAFLPFNNPATLDLFLKEIGKFNYTETEHNDDIGDAYEYLLSITGAQGDIGQFRTPRHIIKFITECVQPTAQDTILDPACGTAGFLIGAYNYIVSQSNAEKGGKLLTAEEKNRLRHNFRGYDIDNTMVRTAEVNMYFHGFREPDIRCHDTLTSTDYWDDHFDVILANPPFMTPKGGIQPHKKFGVSSNRSEVLFVDYIARHLKPHGRAGFVVPEGILANIDGSRTFVRETLLQNGLYAIVSLPVGIFNPYSPTTQTSIIFLDRQIKRNSVLYVRIAHDGYSLGADRHKINEDDLPEALRIITEYIKTEELITNSLDSFVITKDELRSNNIGLRLDFSKAKLLRSSENKTNGMIPLEEIFNIEKGKLQSTKNTPGDYTFVTAAQELSSHNSYTHDQEAITFAAGASGSLGRTHRISGKFIASDLVYILIPKDASKTNIDYYYHYLRLNRETIVEKLKKGSNKKAINKGDLGKLMVPDLPITKQNEINEIISHKQSQIEIIQTEIAKLEDKVTQLVSGQINDLDS